MNILVLGGAGFIGSVVVEQLLVAGHKVVVFDNLSQGHLLAIAENASFVRGEMADGELLCETMQQHAIAAVIHLAGLSLVGESVIRPQKYFATNVGGGIALLDAMLTAGVKKIVFSSTAAVYGAPDSVPIPEDAKLCPLNPYGESKLTFEKMLHWYSQAYGLRYVSLRYFNAAGASEQFGEDHDPETHLIPNVLRVAAGKASHIGIFGDGYPTADGTCVRDYIHVSDLAIAHVLALDLLEQKSDVYNLGVGTGHSVAEVIETAKRVTNRPIPTIVSPRRVGDPPILVASSEKIARELGWKPLCSDLEQLIESAWRWYLSHPNGYDK